MTKKTIRCASLLASAARTSRVGAVACWSPLEEVNDRVVKETIRSVWTVGGVGLEDETVPHIGTAVFSRTTLQHRLCRMTEGLLGCRGLAASPAFSSVDLGAKRPAVQLAAR